MSARAACISRHSSVLASCVPDFPGGRHWPRTRFHGFVQGAQICMVCVHHWRQVKGIWLVVAATTVWSSLTGPCNASCSTTRLPARAFCHHTCWAYRWSFLPSRAWAGHILKKSPREILLHPATSEFEPHTHNDTSSLLQISTVLIQYYYIQFLYTVYTAFSVHYTLCTDSERTPQALVLSSGSEIYCSSGLKQFSSHLIHFCEIRD